MSNQPSKTLLIDVMSTLVYDPFYRVMPAFFGMDLPDLIAAKHPDAWRWFEEGVRDEAWFVENFFLDGRRFDAEGLKRETFEAYAWLDGMESLCGELVDRDVALHYVSNYSNWYHAIEERLGLSRFGHWTFVSCDQGLRKPDPAAYERALVLAGVAAADAVFVDDSQPNVLEAERVGMDSILFRGAEFLRQDLRRRGFLD